ncbi:MAG TPA: hypothetical protein DCR93_28925, partial [Cytophagales bacterium]|nr:hypothetical protein [Cytophagales bacterium]
MTPPHPSSVTLLVVDDEPEIIRLITSTLHMHYPEARLLIATQGKMAIKVATLHLPDVILMDWNMPEMDGLEALYHLLDQPTTREIPIIMLTGHHTESEGLSKALAEGATDYVRKPIDFVELTARVRTALRIRQQHKTIENLLIEEVQQKNRKLSTTSMLMTEKNDILSEAVEQIQKIEKGWQLGRTDVAERLKTLRNQLTSHLELDGSWSLFQAHFEEVHPGFFNQVKALAPDLGHKDLKLCAYLRMGMENKQIAGLLNIAPSSTR